MIFGRGRSGTESTQRFEHQFDFAMLLKYLGYLLRHSSTVLNFIFNGYVFTKQNCLLNFSAQNFLFLSSLLPTAITLRFFIMSTVTLTAVAVLESPRNATGKPLSLMFDAQLWLPGDTPLIAGLRYYNEKRRTFGEINLCLIIAQVSTALLHMNMSLK
jgi:hypothetical protein